MFDFLTNIQILKKKSKNIYVFNKNFKKQHHLISLIYLKTSNKKSNKNKIIS